MGKIEELIEKYEGIISANNITMSYGYSEKVLSENGVFFKVIKDLEQLKSSLPTQQADGVKELIKKIDKETFAYPEMEPEQDDEATEDFKDGYNQASKVIIGYLKTLPTQQDKVAVPELQFPQSVVDWLGEPLEEEKDELMAYLMQYHWNEDSAYDDTLPIEVGEYLAESLSNVVKLLRAIEGESYTVEKEQLYYVELPEKNTDTYNVYGLKKYSDGKINVGYYDKKDIGKSINSKLTEKEIKSVHENYWAFAVPVEEDE